MGKMQDFNIKITYTGIISTSEKTGGYLKSDSAKLSQNYKHTL
jgi:hypothetical protein